MNLIEAMKINGKAKRKAWMMIQRIEFDGNFIKMFDIKDNWENYAVCREDLLADDWEPIREKKKWEGTLKEFYESRPELLKFRANTKLTIEWEE